MKIKSIKNFILKMKYLFNPRFTSVVVKLERLIKNNTRCKRHVDQIITSSRYEDESTEADRLISLSLKHNKERVEWFIESLEKYIEDESYIKLRKGRYLVVSQ